MIRAWWLFRIANTAICPTETATSLVTHDVFSFSRNPMYLGMSMILAALGLAMGSAPFYAALAGFCLIMDRVFCPYEEQKSQAEFGSSYEDYVQSVRRWL